MKNKVISLLLKHKLIRFFLVSGINTAFGYGLFALFLYVGLVYPLALFISTVAGILFNFKTIGSLVFKNHNNILIFKFFGVYGITYLCNLGGLALFKAFEINLYLSGAVLVVPVGILSFGLNRKFVFKEDNLLKKNNYKFNENPKC
jgi:putative flippase GtrA